MSRVISTIALSLLVFSFGGLSAQQRNEQPVYVKVPRLNLRENPNGKINAKILQDTELAIIETKGNWIKVSVEGWVWGPSTSGEFPTIKSKSDTMNLYLAGFDLEHVPTNLKDGRYHPEMMLRLHMKNGSDRVIKAWKALLVVKNAFGDELFRASLVDGKANIKPGETNKKQFYWDNNKFVDDEPFDILDKYMEESIKLELREMALVH